MAKTVLLKDGSEITIRPMTPDDLEKSFTFFQELPPEDRTYLRTDVTKRRNIEKRIRNMDPDQVVRLVGVVDDKIVADGALELSGHTWKSHLGEIRLIVARPYQRKGLGMLMARELFLLAAKKKVKEIVVRMMRPQITARHIFRKLGFRRETVLPDYVVDLSGKKQDLIVMRCNLDALWQEMEHYLTDFDWQRTR